jgi:hypothetical protein
LRHPAAGQVSTALLRCRLEHACTTAR